jgi:GrpB-like predicted nucleotidyltransferase (UPF0157 family)
MTRGERVTSNTIEILPVELVPHSPQWAEMARDETARVCEALGGVLITVHHIGSTSIPGILAKPIIDLIPVAVNLEVLDAAQPKLEALDYRWFGEFGLPGRRYCWRKDPATGKRAVQLHCYAKGWPEIDRHLAFADYLRAHPAIAKDYESEKLRAAALHPDNTLDYNAAKDGWIKRTEADALIWWRMQKAAHVNLSPAAFRHDS